MSSKIKDLEINEQLVMQLNYAGAKYEDISLKSLHMGDDRRLSTTMSTHMLPFLNVLSVMKHVSCTLGGLISSYFRSIKEW